MQQSYLKNVVTLEVEGEKCVGCGMCLAVCPHAVLKADDGRVGIRDRDACMECGACARNCPVQAIRVQAGVGCAAAVINAALGRKGSCCCTTEPGETSDGSPSCSSGAGRGGCC